LNDLGVIVKIRLTRAGLVVAMLFIAACSNGANDATGAAGEESLTLAKFTLDAYPFCRAVDADNLLVDPFSSPVQALYDFDALLDYKPAFGVEAAQACAESLSRDMAKTLLARKDVKQGEAFEAVFFSMLTNDEYEADDDSALHAHFRVLVETSADSAASVDVREQDFEPKNWGFLTP